MDGLADIQDAVGVPSETEVEDFQQHDLAYEIHPEVADLVQAPSPAPDMEDSVSGLLFDDLPPIATVSAPVDEDLHDPSAPLSDVNLLAFEPNHDQDEGVAPSPTLARSQSNEDEDELDGSVHVPEDTGHTRAPVLVRFVFLCFIPSH
jgi:hypothetical protein